jgi:hypothetical protein
MEIINQDICMATEKYILQQCNCLTITALGLAKVLADHFDHGDPYSERKCMGNKNCAIPEDRSVPGTVDILEGEENLPSIICLYGQYRPGKAYSRYYPTSSYPDEKIDRLKYFKQGLSSLLEYFDSIGGCITVAVPYGIGCGLAGGNWKEYSLLLNDFDMSLRKSGGFIKLYKI